MLQADILNLFKNYLKNEKDFSLKNPFFIFEIDSFLFILFKTELSETQINKKEIFIKQKFIPLLGELFKFELSVDENLILKGNLFVLPKNFIVEKSENYLIAQDNTNLTQQNREIFKSPVIIDNTLCFFIDVKTQSQLTYLDNFIGMK